MALADRMRRPGRTRSIRLGDLKVSYVADGWVRLKPLGWLPGSGAEDWAANPGHLDDDGHLAAGVGALLVEAGERALLIDAGYGPQSRDDDPGDPVFGAVRSGTLFDSLAELGRAPGDIEAVAFTHLHPDHVGWAWTPESGGGRPGFPAATYLVGDAEWERRDIALTHGVPDEVLDAMTPKVRTVTEGEEIFPGVRVHAVPGHTVGHTGYVISSGAERLLAFGDALHAPLQVRHPEWSAVVDHDPVATTAHRRRLVAELADSDTIGFGIHFADVVFGRVERDAAGVPTWQPLP